MREAAGDLPTSSDGLNVAASAAGSTDRGTANRVLTASTVRYYRVITRGTAKFNPRVLGLFVIGSNVAADGRSDILATHRAYAATMLNGVLGDVD